VAYLDGLTMMLGRYAKSLSWAVAGTALMTGMMLLGEEPSSDVPVLSLSQAVQTAVDKNRPVNIAKLEIVKSKWEVAQTKTKRFPAITTYLFASGDITNPKFTFPAGLFNNPLPQTLKLSNGITGLASAEVAQPLSQLYQIHLAIREQELSADLAAEQYKGQRLSVVASVKQAYYATLQTESTLDATQALVKQYEETDRVATQYLAEESVLKSDSLEAKA
jgi:outer membrane protein